MGQAAQAYVRERYLGDVHLVRYARLLGTLIAPEQCNIDQEAAGNATIAIAYARRKGLARAAHAFRVHARRGAGARITWLGSSTWAANPGRDHELSASAALPAADAPDCEAAHVVAAHPEQGWSLLCNGVVVFEDTGDLLPDGRIIAPHRAAA